MPKANCVHSTPPTDAAIALVSERPAPTAGETPSTRRRFLALLGGLTAGSAALSGTVFRSDPAIAEPTIPPAATVSEELMALSEEVRARHRAWIDTGEHLNDVINGLRQWEAENPEPRPYDAEGSLPAGRWGVWNEDHKRALKRFGKLKALNAYQVASIVLNDAIGEVVGFQATTMTDIYFKAELAFECDNDRCDLSTSVIEDLLDMPAGAAT